MTSKRMPKKMFYLLWFLYLVLGIIMIYNLSRFKIDTIFLSLSVLFVFPVGFYYDYVIDQNKNLKLSFLIFQSMFFIPTYFLATFETERIILIIIVGVLFLFSNLNYFLFLNDFSKNRKEIDYVKRWNLTINEKTQENILDYLNTKKMGYWLIFLEVIIYTIGINLIEKNFTAYFDTVKIIIVILFSGINAAVVLFDTQKLKLSKFVVIRQVILITIASFFFGMGLNKNEVNIFEYHTLAAVTFYIMYLVLPNNLSRATIVFYNKLGNNM